jgi:hypothetical protein
MPVSCIEGGTRPSWTLWPSGAIPGAHGSSPFQATEHASIPTGFPAARARRPGTGNIRRLHRSARPESLGPPRNAHSLERKPDEIFIAEFQQANKTADSEASLTCGLTLQKRDPVSGCGVARGDRTVAELSDLGLKGQRQVHASSPLQSMVFSTSSVRHNPCILLAECLPFFGCGVPNPSPVKAFPI